MIDSVLDTSGKKSEIQHKGLQNVGLSLNYPFVHGKNVYWGKHWNGIFNLTVDLNYFLKEGRRIGPGFGVYIANSKSEDKLRESGFIMLISALNS